MKKDGRTEGGREERQAGRMDGGKNGRNDIKEGRKKRKERKKGRKDDKQNRTAGSNTTPTNNQATKKTKGSTNADIASNDDQDTHLNEDKHPPSWSQRDAGKDSLNKSHAARSKTPPIDGEMQQAQQRHERI